MLLPNEALDGRHRGIPLADAVSLGTDGFTRQHISKLAIQGKLLLNVAFLAFAVDDPCEPWIMLQHCNRRACHRSEEHTSELQSLMRISYAVFCLKQKQTTLHTTSPTVNRH